MTTLADCGDVVQALRKKADALLRRCDAIIKHRADASDAYLRTAVRTPKAIFVGHQGESHFSVERRNGVGNVETNKHGFVNHKGHFLSYGKDEGRINSYATEHGLHNQDEKDFPVTAEILKRREFPSKTIKTDARADASDPYLRTAVKHENKIYVGHQGEHHNDLADRHGIPQDAHCQRGFVSHAGHFLRPGAAREYALKHSLGEDYGPMRSRLISEDFPRREFKDKVIHTEK